MDIFDGDILAIGGLILFAYWLWFDRAMEDLKRRKKPGIKFAGS